MVTFFGRNPPKGKTSGPGFTKQTLRSGKVIFRDTKGNVISDPQIPDFIPEGTPTTTDPVTGMQVPVSGEGIASVEQPITQEPIPEPPAASPEDVAQMEFLNERERQAIAAAQEQQKVADVEEQKATLANTEIGKGLDIVFAAFAQPFKTIGAIFSPDVTVQETTAEFYQKPVAQQIAKIIVAGAGYAAAIFGVSALLGRAGAGAASQFASTRAVITRTASKAAIGTKSVTTQRAFNALGGTNPARVAKLFNAIQLMRPLAIKTFISKTAFKKIVTVGAALAGTDALFGAWMASDNVMQGSAMYVKDLPWAVRNKAISKEQALAQLEEVQEYKDIATGFVKVSSVVNPLLWPFGKILMTNSKVTQAQIDLARQNIIMARVA